MILFLQPTADSNGVYDELVNDVIALGSAPVKLTMHGPLEQPVSAKVCLVTSTKAVNLKRKMHGMPSGKHDIDD